MRRTKRKFFCVADLTSAIGDGPIGIKADSHKQRASSTAVLGGVGETFLGKILGPFTRRYEASSDKCRSIFKGRKRQKRPRKVSRP